MAQAGIDDGVNRADTGAGQHGDHAFDGQGHIDDYPVAFHHAQRFQTVGEPAHHAIELAIGDDALAAVFAQPNESGAVAAVGVGMTIQGIDRDVGFGPGEPLVMHAIPLQHLVPFSRPRKAGRVIPPKSVGILQGAGTFSLPVFLDNVTGHDRGRGVLLIHDQQV